MYMCYQPYISFLYGFFIAFFLLISPYRSSAEDKTLQLSEIITTAERSDKKSLNDVSGFGSVIDLSELGPSSLSISDILDNQAGVHTRSFGGLGSFSTVSLRGSSPRHVVIQVDNTVLNRARGGVVDLSDIPTGIIERIEIYKGITPSGVAGYAPGGVIRIRTKEFNDRPSLSTHFTYGSFNTAKAGFAYGDSFKVINMVLSSDFQRTDGDFKYLDDNATPFNLNDDQETVRKNNKFQSENHLLKLRTAPWPWFEIELVENFFRKNKGVPGIGALQSDIANYKYQRNILELNVRQKPIADNRLSLQQNISWTDEKMKYTDPHSEIGLGNQDTSDKATSFHVGISAEFHPLDLFAFDSTISFSHEEYTPQDAYRLRTDQTRSRRKTWRPELGITITPPLPNRNLRFFLRGGYILLQNDFHGAPVFGAGSGENDREQAQFTYRTGVNFSILKNLFLKANFGYYFYPPEFTELFGDQGSLLGNPDLVPEKGFNRDIGFEYYISPNDGTAMSFGISYFYNTTENLIQFIQNSQMTAIARNISSSTARGFEFFTHFKFASHVNIAANYTRQEARNTSRISYLKDKYIPGRPVDQVHTAIRIYPRTWMTAEYTLNFTSGNFLDGANIKEARKREIHNARMIFTPVDNLSLSAEVQNVTDNQISDIAGYPLPGRAWFGNLSLCF